VTVDLHALDQLNKGPTGPKAPPKKGHKESRPKPAGKSETARRTPAEQAPVAVQPPPPPPVVASPAVPPSTAPPGAILPSGPPPNVRLSPLAPETPAAKPPPPPEPVVAADAGGAAAPISEGLRITFGSGRAELSPATEGAIKNFAHTAPKTENASINVLAYAAGTQDDPSTARRLSLSRALAVRSVLMAEGIASTRIYVRALGAASGDGPPDRADLTVMGSSASAEAPGAPK
jgi:outer membrane protein OmpA-like peptidoglycan-associated protein